MRRQRNSTIYTGKVGARMKPPSARRPMRRVVRESIQCVGGPFDGKRIRLDVSGGYRTLQFVVGRHVGHYLGSKWVPA